MPTPRLSLALAALTALACTVADARAQAFTPGNILASTAGRLYELDQTLQVIRVLQVPLPPGGGRYDVVDVVVDVTGRAHVLITGLLNPGSIATYDPIAGTWEQHPVAAFLGNVSDGDLTLTGSYLFTKSLRIELPSFTSTAVQIPGRGVGEISAGLDGRVFALEDGSPRSGIRVIDPETLQVTATYVLPGLFDSRGITSLPNGELVIADWNGTITRYTPDAQTALAQLQTGGSNLYDVEAAPDGRIVAGSRFGDVLLTDTNLNRVQSVIPGSSTSGVYVAFVPELGPNVDEVLPPAGTWRGPGTVEIRGRFFANSSVTGVRFGGVPATQVTLVDDTTIRCTAPAGVPGPVTVSVDNAIAPAELVDGFVYTPGITAPDTVAPGGTLEMDLWLEQPGDLVALLIGTPGGSPVTIPGIDSSMTLGNPALFTLAPIWPTAIHRTSLVLPNNPNLLGAVGAFQGLSGVTGRITWTNAATVRVDD
ncbi:MAG: IPT/TIG domain-containing protein [Planctomycetota bacterium]|nr:IPT/TIG domain-containing protein [Planctomycetota bacterium]MDA0932487.1 IPT/TIG domain-containing protein [Planctomycetota bacterium]MDA1220585.1 IPT/TIG domain-containing protein [Planctomycetota bacterium]